MRQSIQKELGIIKEATDIKVRNPRPYCRKEKHKENFILSIV